MLIAVPIPKEHSASGSLIESAIQTALREARWTVPAIALSILIVSINSI